MLNITLRCELENQYRDLTTKMADMALVGASAKDIDALAKATESVSQMLVAIDKSELDHEKISIDREKLETEERIANNEIKHDTIRRAIGGAGMCISSIICACLEQYGQVVGKMPTKLLTDAYTAFTKRNG